MKAFVTPVLSRLRAVLKTYLFFTCLLASGKPLFLAFHWDQARAAGGPSQWLAVLWHGLPLDLSCAGYFTILPALFAAASAFRPLPIRILDAYAAAAACLTFWIMVPDADVYTYWGTHMDAPTILFYLQSPRDAAASFTWTMVLRDGALIAAGILLTLLAYRKLLRPAFLDGSTDSQTAPVSCQRRADLLRAPVILAASGLLFIPIRGGLTTATMNVGRVYFSQNPFLNHAAVDAVWNFLDSFQWKRDFAEQYRFMDSAQASALFGGLKNPGESRGSGQGGEKLLKTGRPDILLVILESFSGNYVAPLGGAQGDAMPRLAALFESSVAFTNIYASGTRTDSGVVAVLGGYPAQPKSRIMARPDKSLAIPGIGKALKAAGYDLAFYYGGDEDFANMRSYLVGNGFERITGEKDFGREEVRTKWGVYDHVLFRRLLEELDRDAALPAAERRPFFKVALTLTSHEPFTIPTEPRFPGTSTAELFKSALAYSDGALGDFIDAAKTRPWWDSTLIILVADHSTPYPDFRIHDPKRYRIPLLWTGGAIERPRTVETIGSQTDIAATLLSELGLTHREFTFSHDLMDPAAPHYAFYTFSDGFGFVDGTGASAYDCGADRPVHASPPDDVPGSDRRILLGKACLQTLFDDLASLKSRTAGAVPSSQAPSR